MEVGIMDESLGKLMEDQHFKFTRFEKKEEVDIFSDYFYYYMVNGMEGYIKINLIKTENPFICVITYGLPKQIDENDMKSFWMNRLFAKKCSQFQSELTQITPYNVKLEVIVELNKQNIISSFLHFLYFRSRRLKTKKG